MSISFWAEYGNKNKEKIDENEFFENEIGSFF